VTAKTTPALIAQPGTRGVHFSEDSSVQSRAEIARLLALHVCREVNLALRHDVADRDNMEAAQACRGDPADALVFQEFSYRRFQPHPATARFLALGGPAVGRPAR